jgi:hypothetical protein
MTPGSEKVLKRFIDEVRAGTFATGSDSIGRAEIDKLHDALEEWGAVKSIEFTGTAGPRQWTAYRVRTGAGAQTTSPTVEVRWNLFEVIHEHETTEWLIAVDRDGTIWAARASPAPWL